MRRALLAALLASSLVACGGRGRARAPAAPPAPAASPPPTIPVPETLAFTAGHFGLTMTAEGWTWKVLRRNLTRFDWSGRPTKGDRELLYSFFMDKLDESSLEHLPQIVAAAAANLSAGEPCRPVEQPPEIVRALGVDRVVTVCFEPSTFYGRELHSGVLHGVVHEGALTIVAMLSNDRTLGPPRPESIGARGTPASR